MTSALVEHLRVPGRFYSIKHRNDAGRRRLARLADGTMKNEDRHIGYYSLVQYCPDHRRREVANVGVALFIPSLGFGDTKLAQEPVRAKSMFGATNVDTELLALASKAFRAQFVGASTDWQSVESMELFGKKLGNALVMTKPEVVLVEKPVDELDAIFRDLVEIEKPPN